MPFANTKLGSVTKRVYSTITCQENVNEAILTIGSKKDDGAMANDTVEKVRRKTETDIEVQKDQLLTVDQLREENRIGVEEIHKW